jgi:hypothetical protein
MTKDSFKIEKGLILNQINDLKNSLRTLEGRYIESCREFKNGDMVLIINSNGGSREGVVVGYEVNYLDELKPIIKKIKKDGTPSNVRIHIWFNEKIEKK